ncbi:MAG: ATP phosphoribosyltransferase catalytic subunit HisG, partial [Gemmobacter sp.]
MTLRLALPSKGRLMEQCFAWFAARGRPVVLSGEARTYAATVEAAEVEIALMSAAEVPRELSAGRIHLGVTGSDLVRETLADWKAEAVPLAPMG